MFDFYQIDEELIESYIISLKEKVNIKRVPDLVVKFCNQYGRIQNFLKDEVISQKKQVPVLDQIHKKLKFKLSTKEKGSLEFCEKKTNINKEEYFQMAYSDKEPLIIPRDTSTFPDFKSLTKDDYPVVYQSDMGPLPLVFLSDDGAFSLYLKGKRIPLIKGIVIRTTIFEHLLRRSLTLDKKPQGECYNPSFEKKCDFKKINDLVMAVDFKIYKDKLFVLIIPFSEYDEQTGFDRRYYDYDEAVWVQFFKDSDFHQNLNTYGC